jgi:DNA-binding GntR family transcriptional regulator
MNNPLVEQLDQMSRRPRGYRTSLCHTSAEREAAEVIRSAHEMLESGRVDAAKEILRAAVSIPTSRSQP